MDYKKLLEYYLTSSEWDFQCLTFFEAFDHHYDPNEGEENWGIIYLCSEIYMEYRRRLDAAGGYLWLDLTEKQFQTYFSHRYSEEQRFAVLFSTWWGLTAGQINRVASLHQQKSCLIWLNYFLCNPNASPNLTITEARGFHYSGKYYAEIYNQQPQKSTGLPDRIIPAEKLSSDAGVSFA